ncbi:MAG: hypothetical protein ACXWVS_14105 [Hyphomicrobium sp.]
MLILIGLFLLSMNDFYVPAISGAPFPVVGVGLIWLSSQTFHRPRRLEVVLFALLLLGIVVGFVRVFADPSVEIWPTNLAGWSLGFLLLMTNLQEKQAEIKRSMHTLLIAHVGFFYLQALVYSLSGHYIDPVSWLTGEASRYLAEDITTFASIFSIRPTGAFLEPSNYAAHILPLSLLYYISKDQLTPVVAAALASVALTFSSWAFVAVGLSLTLFINNKVSRNAIIIIAFVFFAAIFSDWFITRTFEMRYDSGETPAEFRWVFAAMVFDDAIHLSPGLGVGVRDAGLGDLGAFTINDSGAAIYFFYVFGAYALVLLIALFWSAPGWRQKILLVLILGSKLTPTYPFFWLLMNLITRETLVRTAEEGRSALRRNSVTTERELASERNTRVSCGASLVVPLSSPSDALSRPRPSLKAPDS